MSERKALQLNGRTFRNAIRYVKRRKYQIIAPRIGFED